MKTIKLAVTVFVLCIGLSVYSQSKTQKGKLDFKDVKIENYQIKVEVDSVEELESTFTIEDFENILNEAELDKEVTFALKCNGEMMSKSAKSSMSYTIHGNTNEKEKFLKGVEKIRNSAIKYYKSKK